MLDFNSILKGFVLGIYCVELGTIVYLIRLFRRLKSKKPAEDKVPKSEDVCCECGDDVDWALDEGYFCKACGLLVCDECDHDCSQKIEDDDEDYIPILEKIREKDEANGRWAEIEIKEEDEDS